MRVRLVSKIVEHAEFKNFAKLNARTFVGAAIMCTMALIASSAPASAESTRRDTSQRSNQNSIQQVDLNSLSSAVDRGCLQTAGSLPRPAAPIGAADKSNPIEHIIIIMQENHTFDNYFGMLNSSKYYGSQVDGIQPNLSNLDHGGNQITVHAESNLCLADPPHSWNAIHSAWNGGAMDGFVQLSDQKPGAERVMAYYGPNDIPYYYALADQFAISDRYFSSVLTSTFPNRFFLLTGTSFGHIKNDMPHSKQDFAQTTIFDVLNRYGVSWNYFSDSSGYLKLFQPLYLGNLDRLKRIKDFDAALENNTLPQVSVLDASFDGQDEHPDGNIQNGQKFVASRVNALMNSPYWKNSVFFLTYDEGGGFYDHVAPPKACAPDNIAPMLEEGSYDAKFDRYGIRVPFIAISPYAKHHYVSHLVNDHASILKFIETKFNLPALTTRDANASDLTDMFDFNHPVYAVKSLPSAEPDPDRACKVEPSVAVPTTPIAIQSRKTGLCLDASSSIHGEDAPLVYQKCNDQPSQSFVLQKDRFSTWTIHNVQNGNCFHVDWIANTVNQTKCVEDEDQGFAVSSSKEGYFYFSGWHLDFCFSGKANNGQLGLLDCYTPKEIDVEFFLLPQDRYQSTKVLRTEAEELLTSVPN